MPAATPNIPLSLSIVPGGFRDRLRQINQSLQPSTLALRITVPDDLSFWYFLEFGSAGRQDADAPVKSAHSGSYEIKPKLGHGALKFRNRFSFSATNPGIRPRLIYRGIRGDLFEYIASLNLARALVGSETELGLPLPETMHAIMLYAVNAMADRLETEAPGVREGGRLEGRSAGETFREEAQIEQVEI